MRNDIVRFRRTILNWYHKNGRHDLAWRKTRDPYKIFVSEVMLQQTQISRVTQKYREFLRAFPSVRVLATASTRDVLSRWQGLGYNRRALYLHRAARQIMKENAGVFPRDVSDLELLPGIGRYTARAISVFVANAPEILLETNIRRVMLHFFFPDEIDVSDARIESLLGTVLYKKNPRMWYWAMMDYGAGPLKKIKNPNQRSKYYSKQSAFKGSRRYVRAKIVALLLHRLRGMSVVRIERALIQDPHCRMYLAAHALLGILADLVQEGMLGKKGTLYCPPSH